MLVKDDSRSALKLSQVTAVVFEMSSTFTPMAARWARKVAVMSRDELMMADELFLSNAVRGIVPVRRLVDHRYASMSAARALMRALHPALGLPVVD